MSIKLAGSGVCAVIMSKISVSVKHVGLLSRVNSSGTKQMSSVNVGGM